MKWHMQIVSRLALSLALVGAVAWLYAGDLTPPRGSISPTMKSLVEVEPRRAVGSLSGDDEALHVISEPGSYYLTANIVGEAGKSGIKIATDNVTLDLAGFALIGVEGSTEGIRPSGFHFNATIKNGTVTNWDGDGVTMRISREDEEHLLANVNITGILAHGNGRSGLRVSNGTVQDCVAEENGAYGILVLQGTIDNCTARKNAADGIRSFSSSVIRGCLARDNEVKGIRATSSHVVHCNALFNKDVGIDAGNRSTVLECTSRINFEGGISAGTNCYILNNNCNGNLVVGGSGAGIRALSRNRIDGNDLTGNAIGIEVSGDENIIVRNSATGNVSTNFVIADGNTFGPIVQAAGAGDISAVANADHPWANFEY